MSFMLQGTGSLKDTSSALNKFKSVIKAPNIYQPHFLKEQPVLSIYFSAI